MEKVAFMMKLKEGMLVEYKKRHDQVWPEMIEVLKSAGRHNYSIWHLNNTLIGCYEVENAESSLSILKNSNVFKRWSEYMSDVLEPINDLDGKHSCEMDMVFYLE